VSPPSAKSSLLAWRTSLHGWYGATDTLHKGAGVARLTLTEVTATQLKPTPFALTPITLTRLADVHFTHRASFVTTLRPSACPATCRPRYVESNEMRCWFPPGLARGEKSSPVSCHSSNVG